MTTTRNLALPAASVLLLALGVQDCFALAQVARGTLTLTTSATGTYDSYFVGETSPESEYSYSLRPALQFNRSAGRSQLSANAGVGFVWYDKNSQLDSEDFFGSASLTLPVVEGARLDGSASVSYTESTVLDPLVNDRIPSRNIGAGLNFSYLLGLKMSLSESLTYSRSLREIYSDQEVYSNALSFSYRDFLRGTTLSLSHSFTRTTSSGDNLLGADLDQYSNSFSAGLSRPILGPVVGTASLGYSLMDRSAGETTAGQTSKGGLTFGVGISGPFLPRSRFPKLTSSMSVNYQQSPSLGINDTGNKSLSGNVSLEWSARERTSLYVRANRGTTLSASDLTVVDTSVSMGVTERVGQSTTLTGNATYSWNTFRGISRKDQVLSASLGANHTFARYWSVGASYQYQDTSSDASGVQAGRFAVNDHDRHTVTATISATF